MLIGIIDASWKVTAYYNGVCMRRGDCYVCLPLDSKYHIDL